MAAQAGTGGGRPPVGRKAIVYSEVVDLSHAVAPGIPVWPGDPPVSFQHVSERARDGYALRRFCMGEHSGTHLTAPLSFFEGGASVDAYEPAALVAPAVVLDVRRQASGDPDYALPVDDVQAWERRYGRIPAGSVVLLFTGWQERWRDPAAFFNRGPDGRLHFPGFSERATRWLLDERHLRGVGTDAHGADPGIDASFGTSRQVLDRPRILLECLANLDKLPPVGATLVIGALRLCGGTGSPSCVLAFVP